MPYGPPQSPGNYSQDQQLSGLRDPACLRYSPHSTWLPILTLAFPQRTKLAPVPDSQQERLAIVATPPCRPQPRPRLDSPLGHAPYGIATPLQAEPVPARWLGPAPRSKATPFCLGPHPELRLGPPPPPW